MSSGPAVRSAADPARLGWQKLARHAARQTGTAPPKPWLRVLPRTLFGRSLLIVLLPLLILQAVLTYVFYERHWDSVTRWLAVGLAGEVGLMVDLLEDAPDREARARVLDMARHHFGLAVSLEPKAALAPAVEAGGLLPITSLDETLADTFD
ncbi:MAG: two-component sensor histidine kinase, partial [Geminicoccales bacterium]